MNEESYIENQGEQKTISLPEGIIMLLVVAFADIIEFFIGLNVFGIIFGEAVNFFIGAIIEGWLIFRGIKGVWKLASFPIGSVIDGLFGGFLPAKTITLLIVIYLINRPEKMEIAGKFSPIAKK